MKIHRPKFSIDINAEKSRIWQSIWNDTSYRYWIAAFSKDSYFVIDNWQAGGKIHFLGPNRNGIYSKIELYEPNKIVRFKHIGKVLEGAEQEIDPETKVWSGATEVYSLSSKTHAVTLTVELDILDEHLDFMSEKFPAALERIKEMAEKRETI